jgi:hypothetical protein
LKLDPLLKNLRGDPRYSDLLKKMQLPAWEQLERPPQKQEPLRLE